MAIDGVAPRAKMNQQRTRRFRSAGDAREKAEIKQQTREVRIGEAMGTVIYRVVRLFTCVCVSLHIFSCSHPSPLEIETNVQEMREMGLPVPPEELDMEWDSNVITPGTPFMDKLANYLRFYIAERINTSKAWQQIKVPRVFSIEKGGGG